MNKKWFSVIIVALLITVGILIIKAPWGNTENSKFIKIGVINSLTGPAGVLGRNIQNGIDLAVEEINSAGGINGLLMKLIVEDDATESKNSVSAFNKLVNIEKVTVIIGPASSGGVMACSSLANKNKVVLLSPGAGSPNITHAGPYVFRNRVAGNLEAKKLADFVFNELRLKRIGIFRINTDYGVGFARVFKNSFESSGGEIVATESFEQGDTDFKSQLTKLNLHEIEGIYMVGVPHECGLILKQAKELGLTSSFFSNNIESDELLQVAGDSAEGLIYVISAYDSDKTHDTQQFNYRYNKKYKKRSDMFAADGYDAVYILKNAIESAGLSGEKIREALLSLKNFKGVNGTISFDQNGDVIKEVAIKEVTNGKFVPYKFN